MAPAASLGEWPSLIRNTFLTQTKNNAGITGVKLFMRGKPYVISVDDNLAFFNTSHYNQSDYGGGGPVFAFLSKDNRTIWGAVLEKAYAKLHGNYRKLSGGFLENGIRSLTGAPISSYEISELRNEDRVFDLLKAADSANNIITLNSFLKQWSWFNGCGLVNFHAYSLLSVFNMTDTNNTNFGCLLIRNPWGEEPYYNTSFNSSSSRWTDSLVAQVPFGIDPRTSQ